jgi:multiple sugar transport system substrate-binding protein
VTLLTAQCQVFYYRTDLFQAAGLKPPRTLQELEEAAKALHQPAKQQYGITLRRAGKWATTQIGTYLYALGGRWIGDDGRVAVDTPEMGKTLEFYGGLLRKYGPPGAPNIGERENPAILQQGQAAMMTELNHWKLVLNDPEQSPKVAGKIATTVIPRGPVEGPVPGGHFIMLPVQNAAISSFSRHKEAAWYFVQWLTSKQSFVRRQLKGNSSARLSTWSDPTFLGTPPAKQNPDWIDASLTVGTFIRIALPLVAPGLVAASVLDFIYSWNNFQMALILGGGDTKTAPMVVLSYIGSEALDWGSMTAAASLVTAPTALFVLLVQRYLVKGLTMGGLKG